jgi:hypothetical protein
MGIESGTLPHLYNCPLRRQKRPDRQTLHPHFKRWRKK